MCVQRVPNQQWLQYHSISVAGAPRSTLHGCCNVGNEVTFEHNYNVTRGIHYGPQACCLLGHRFSHIIDLYVHICIKVAIYNH